MKLSEARIEELENFKMSYDFERDDDFPMQIWNCIKCFEICHDEDFDEDSMSGKVFGDD